MISRETVKNRSFRQFLNAIGRRARPSFRDKIEPRVSIDNYFSLNRQLANLPEQENAV
jgi:hypothetical protein